MIHRARLCHAAGITALMAFSGAASAVIVTFENLSVAEGDPIGFIDEESFGCIMAHPGLPQVGYDSLNGPDYLPEGFGSGFAAAGASMPIAKQVFGTLVMNIDLFVLDVDTENLSIRVLDQFEQVLAERFVAADPANDGAAVHVEFIGISGVKSIEYHSFDVSGGAVPIGWGSDNISFERVPAPGSGLAIVFGLVSMTRRRR